MEEFRMDFLGENDEKILELTDACNALEEQIREVRSQTDQFYLEKVTGKKSGIFNNPLGMKRVVLTWLTAYHSSGLTGRELLNDRDSLQEYAGMKFSRRVEAYSMFLGRLDKKRVHARATSLCPACPCFPSIVLFLGTVSSL
jgi:TPP-dependent indolepyruvate ferredoxin oxidoreductase alpha subunit